VNGPNDTPPKPKRRRWRWLFVVVFFLIAAVWWGSRGIAVARREAFIDLMRKEFVTIKMWRTGPDGPLIRTTGLGRLFYKDHYLFVIETERQADALLSAPLPSLENIEVAASAKLSAASIERITRHLPDVTIVQ